jgi:hypothetical protein
MLHLTELGAEIFINRAKKKSLDTYWDNYDLIIWKKNHSGFTDLKGMFRNNSWGIADRVSVDSNGIWVLPLKYVKYFR